MKAFQMARYYLLLATILPLAAPLPGAAQELDLAPKILYELKGDAAFNRNFGMGVWTLQDVDGDTHDDLLVTDWKAISGSHIVVHAAVYSGSDGRLLHHLDHDQSGVSSLFLNGRSFAQLGDLDGDRIADFIGGDRRHIIDVEGRAFIFSGKTGSMMRVHRGTTGFGYGVYALGDLDLDGDGIREVAVADTSWNDYTGQVFIYSFGPASQDPEPYRPGNPQLTVNTTPEEVTIAWPAAITDPQPQWSTDLQTWKPVFEGTAPESGRFELPGTEAQPQQYFRLRYKNEE